AGDAGGLVPARVRLRGRGRGDRRGHPRVAFLPRDGRRGNRGALLRGAERGGDARHPAGRQRQGAEQREHLRGRALRGRRLPRPLHGVHQRAEPAQPRLAQARVPPHARGAGCLHRRQRHHRVRPRPGPVRVRGGGRGGHPRRAGLRTGRGRAGAAGGVDVPVRRAAGRAGGAGRRHHLRELRRPLRTRGTGRAGSRV
ncbi:MAG: UDP-2-acetamido-3-amino-2,3-dideoxy-D-glucuronic acid acetyltransferase, partial [uncultured Gemmatimonadetes bacterium]